MRPLVPHGVVLALAAALSAQSTISPVAYAKAEGNTANGIPLGASSMRYAQIHGDLRGKALVIRGLAFRRDGVSNSSTGKARTLDLEIIVAEANHAAVSATFASNYVTPPVVAMQRKKISLPAWDKGPSAGAKAVFVFDHKWPFSGKRDLLWEFRVHGSSLGRQLGMPADAFNASTIAEGPQRMLGTGCLTRAGNGRPMTLLSELHTNSFSGTMSLRWFVNAGSERAPGVLLLGFTNPNVVIPHLCGHGRLLAIGQIILQKVTNRSGFFDTGTGFVPYWKGASGLRIFAQAITFDHRQKGLWLATSNGLATTTPGLSPGAQNVTRLFSTQGPGATTGTINRSTGLVTELLQ